MDRSMGVTAVGDLEALMVGMKLNCNIVKSASPGLKLFSKVLHLVLNREEQQEGGKSPSCG